MIFEVKVRSMTNGKTVCAANVTVDEYNSDFVYSVANDLIDEACEKTGNNDKSWFYALIISNGKCIERIEYD